MADIYQQIWDADLEKGCGVKAYRSDEGPTDEQKAAGYVLVDEEADPDTTNDDLEDHRLLVDVSIPEQKMESYKRVSALFNNYVLDQTKIDPVLSEESTEIQDFLEWVVATPSNVIARNYLSEQTGETVSEDAWWAILERVWFERYDMGANKNLSGFEHSIVGEQKQGKVNGYHFWYKYHVDEAFEVPNTDGTTKDLISVLGFKHTHDDETPDVATLSFKWNAFDYVAREFRPLTKPKGGFWIGPSIEALLAIGTLAFLPESQAPRQAEINGFRYHLRVHPGSSNRNIRTFYPEFAGPV